MSSCYHERANHGFGNRALVKAVLRLRNAYKDSAFEASKVVSTNKNYH